VLDVLPCFISLFRSAVATRRCAARWRMQTWDDLTGRVAGEVELGHRCRPVGLAART
jgi:hypothetical protein